MQMNLPIIRTKHHYYVRATDSMVVLYNTILNCPLIIDNAALDFYERHESIDVFTWNGFSLDQQAIVQTLFDSFLYLEKGKDEQYYSNQNIKEHLEKLSSGLLTEWLDLRVSEGCNFGCPHCIAGKDKHNTIMPIQTAIEVVDQFIAFKRKVDPEFNVLQVHFGNCEPLLNFEAIKAVVDHINLVYSNLETSYTINTNLSLLTDTIADYCKEHDIKIFTSLDGLHEANDSIRVYKNGKGTFLDIIRSIESLRIKGYPIKGISVTLTDRNRQLVGDEFIEWAKDNQLTSVAYDYDLIHTMSIPAEEKASFLCDTWEKYEKQGIEFFGTWKTPFIKLSNESAAISSYAFCKASEGRNYSVDRNGNIFNCSFSNDPISSIETYEKDIQPGGRIYTFVKDRLAGNVSRRNCKGCIIEGACAGQCEMTCNCSEELIEHQCDFYKAITKKMLAAEVRMMDI